MIHTGTGTELLVNAVALEFILDVGELVTSAGFRLILVDPVHAEIAGWRSGPCRSLTDAAEEAPAYTAVSASDRGRDAQRTLQLLDEMQLDLQPDVIASVHRAFRVQCPVEPQASSGAWQCLQSLGDQYPSRSQP